MSFTTNTLLSSTTYGTPSGNYDGSSAEFVGNAVIAANYYGGQGSVQTVAIRVTNFEGEIRLEATLEDSQAVNTEQAAWFETYVYGADSSIHTDYHPVTLTGNFTYMRVRVLKFEAGTINSITISY